MWRGFESLREVFLLPLPLLLLSRPIHETKTHARE